jgi:hypothetical protein
MKTTHLVDDFITKKECKYLINFYKSYEFKSFDFRDVHPLDLQESSMLELEFLFKKLNKYASKFKAKLEWTQIVKWPVGSTQNLHFDDVGDPVLTSVLYLNDNYKGGQTYYEEGTIFKPKTGRIVYFDGQQYKHGVKPVEKETRFVVAAWYRGKNVI